MTSVVKGATDRPAMDQVNPRGDMLPATPPTLEAVASDASMEPETKKRKAGGAHQGSPTKKVRSLTRNRDYRLLLNEMIHEASNGHAFDDEEEEGPLRASQLGASTWNSQEKEAFFQAVAVLGKDNVQGIAARIKSKSAFEVASYVRLLQHGLVEKNIWRNRQQLLGASEMPAACEIGQDCCDRLDQVAASLNERQRRGDASRGRAKWGVLWRLTPEIGEMVESKLAEADGAQQVAAMLPAAGLLRLKSWLELSRDMFMNPAPPRDDDNWRNMASADDGYVEMPSIDYTAFQDFASLAVSVTERLVQATLFQAMSRCRAMHSRHFTQGFDVQAEDVWGACQVLKMPSNAQTFWTRAARRCGLHVCRHVSELDRQHGEEHWMSYEEVESILSGKKTKAAPSGNTEVVSDSPMETGIEDAEHSGSIDPQSPSSSSPGSSSSERTQPESPRDDDDDDSGSEASLETSSSSGRASCSSSISIDSMASDFIEKYSHESRRLRRRRAKRKLQQAHEDYMEAVDQHASSIEETRLWKILGVPAPMQSSSGVDAVDEGDTREEEREGDRREGERGEEEDAEGEDGEAEAEVENRILPGRPPRERRRVEDLVDWRAKMEYWAEWETLGRVVPEDAFRNPPSET